jgi:hypothetical protein
MRLVEKLDALYTQRQDNFEFESLVEEHWPAISKALRATEEWLEIEERDLGGPDTRELALAKRKAVREAMEALNDGKA